MMTKVWEGWVWPLAGSCGVVSARAYTVPRHRRTLLCEEDFLSRHYVEFPRLLVVCLAEAPAKEGVMVNAIAEGQDFHPRITCHPLPLPNSYHHGWVCLGYDTAKNYESDAELLRRYFDSPFTSRYWSAPWRRALPRTPVATFPDWEHATREDNPIPWVLPAEPAFPFSDMTHPEPPYKRFQQVRTPAGTCWLSRVEKKTANEFRYVPHPTPESAPVVAYLNKKNRHYLWHDEILEVLTPPARTPREER